MGKNSRHSVSKTSSPPPSVRSFSPGLLIFILLVFVIGLIYSNTFKVPFVFDDEKSIVANELIHIYRLSQINLSWLGELIRATRSFALFSFAFNFYFGKLNVFGYHIFNLIIHILASWTVFYFVRCILDLAGSESKRTVRIASVVSVLFAIHPIQTQAVTYIVQRETSMATLLYLWAVLFYIRARITHRKENFLFCAFFFLLAVATKQNAAILPVVLLGVEFYFFQESKFEWLRKKPALLGGAMLVPVISGFIYTGPNIISWFNQRYAERSFTLLERVLTQQRVLLHYLTLLFFPSPSRLNLDYDFPVSHGLTSPTVIAIAFTVTALVLMVRLAKHRPVLSFCIFWFYTNLVIESSILALEMVYEHRLYLPAIGIFLLFVILLDDHVLRFPQRRHWGMTGVALFAVILCIFTFERNRVWKDDMTLWSDSLRKSPNKSRPHNNLGNAYLSRGDPQRAIELHQRAIELDKKNYDAYYNLANDYLKVNRLTEAIESYKEAFRLKYDYAKAYANLGTVYNILGRYDDSIRQARLALKYRPYYVDVYYNLANAFFYKKDYQTCIKNYKHVVSVKPDHDKAHNNLGSVYLLLKQYEKSEEHFKLAMNYSPRAADYVNNLGMAYKMSGNFQEAIKVFSRAARMQPDYSDPYHNIARIMVEQKKIPESIQVLSAYLRVKPDHSSTIMLLGLVFADYTNEVEKAIELLQKALQLNPNMDKAKQIEEKIELLTRLTRLAPGG